MGALLGIAGSLLGGVLGGGGSGGGDPIGALSSQMNKSLADQAQMLALQEQYQSKKAALDLVSNILNSDHQSKEQIAQKLGDS